MATEHKREKRKLRKQKKRENRILQEQKNLEQRPIDIMDALKSELTDTKPNMAKFLDKYVQIIQGMNPDKIYFYPKFKFNVSKIFVKFIDGHELIYDMLTDGKFTPKYYYSYKFDELKISEKDSQVIETFFQNILRFKFVFCDNMQKNPAD